MDLMKRINTLIFLIFFCFLSLLEAKPSFAKDFDTFFHTSYKFDKDGVGHVTHEISLVNKTTNYYVSEYTLSVVGGDISDIESYDKIGPVKAEKWIKDKTTLITLSFNEKVVGEEKVLSFILKYKVSDIAKKEGNLWQVSLPKLANYDPTDDYSLDLFIPSSMGKIAFVNPSPKSEEKQGEYHKLSFERDRLLKYGVVVTIGQYQTFNFEISYDLENPTSSLAYTKIALPPDTSNQTIYYSSLEPNPSNVEQDEDGNWLATYNLKPKEKFSVKANGVANIFSKPVRKTLISGEETKKYLKETQYWQNEDEKIKSLANTLKTPENIYNYVVSTLSYDYSQLENTSSRKGALKSLENPGSAICTDFTDLFISIARSAGIPARQINGYAYSDDPKLNELAEKTDTLHSWAEYYDFQKNEWIMVDPTWGNTSGGLDYFNKFDMSHFAFVIHGTEDDFPLTPGSYKAENDNKKQVFVSLGKDDFINSPEYFEIRTIKPGSIFSIINNHLEVEFVNTSGFAFYDKKLIIESGEKTFPSSKPISFSPPFSRFNLNFVIKPEERLKDYKTHLNFSIGDSTLENSLLVNSIIIRLSIIFGVFFSALIVLLLYRLKKKKSCNESKSNDTVLLKDQGA